MTTLNTLTSPGFQYYDASVPETWLSGDEIDAVIEGLKSTQDDESAALPAETFRSAP